MVGLGVTEQATLRMAEVAPAEATLVAGLLRVREVTLGQVAVQGGVVEEGEVPLSPGVVSPSRRLAELVAVAGLATLLQIRRGLVEIPMRVTTV